MRSFIFLTDEGYTFQPNSESTEPDIDNLQVVGFARGENEEQALQNMIDENEWLLKSTFNEIFSLELKDLDYYQKAKRFDITEKRK